MTPAATTRLAPAGPSMPRTGSMLQAPDVPLDQVQPALAECGGQQRLGRDPRLGPSQQGGRAVDAHDAPSLAGGKAAQQPAGAAAEIQHCRPAAPRLLAIEDEVLHHLVVLQVVQLRQQVGVGRLAGEDVAAHGGVEAPDGQPLDGAGQQQHEDRHRHGQRAAQSAGRRGLPRRRRPAARGGWRGPRRRGTGCGRGSRTRRAARTARPAVRPPGPPGR